MKMFLFVLIAIFGIGGMFCLASYDNASLHTTSKKIDVVPTPDTAGLCHKCALQPYCLPRMQCWEAYREAVKEILEL